MRFAVIGLGMVSDMHFAALAGLRGQCDVAGVFSRRADRRAEVAARTGTRAFDSIARIAADPGVDAAIVLTPPNARTGIVEELAQAGKHILLEKPIERTLDAARHIVETCESHRVTLGVVFQHRLREGATTLAARLGAGALGDVALVQAEIPWWRAQSYYDEPGRGSWAQDGGGVLITQAIHTLDLMLSLAGPVQAVTAMTATTALHRMQAEDFAVAGLQFASGAVGSVTASTAIYPGAGETLRIVGTSGSAVLTGGELTINYADGRSEAVGASAGTGGGSDPMAFTADWHRAVISDFALAVSMGRAPRITGRDGLRVHALIDAVQRAAATGTRAQVEAAG